MTEVDLDVIADELNSLAVKTIEQPQHAAQMAIDMVQAQFEAADHDVEDLAASMKEQALDLEARQAQWARNVRLVVDTVAFLKDERDRIRADLVRYDALWRDVLAMAANIKGRVRSTDDGDENA